MFKNKVIFLLSIIFFITSCAGTFDSVKRGLTGQKENSTDEFLVEKKDPLILPPNFETLPSPDERRIAKQEISSFEETLKNKSLNEEDSLSSSSSASSVEESILHQIRKK